MSATALDTAAAPADLFDQRVILRGVSWEVYESLLAARGESAAVRLTYRIQELELMTPSRQHEMQKTRLARLVETYAEEIGLTLEGIGSWTLRSDDREYGAEPDECYVLGTVEDEITRPDLVIEVVWTSGGINKLEVYRGLGVGEVWIWQHGKLGFFVLENDAYRSVDRSGLLPELDPELIATCMAEPSQTAALARLRSELRR